MDCELCGKKGEMYRAVVEDSQMTVCNACSKYGHVTGKVRQVVEVKKKPKQAKEEPVEVVVSNFGELLRKKREQAGMSQKEFARKIAEKESILHKMETGSLVPTMETARKLERMLSLKLVEEITEEASGERKKDNQVMTLGDFVTIKTRKKK